MTTTIVNIPAPTPAPRGALWAANLFYGLLSMGQGAWSAEMQHRAQRARLAEAAQARAYARELERHDPRSAADLYAAADRHEQIG
jgi:hypothetical protein